MADRKEKEEEEDEEKILLRQQQQHQLKQSKAKKDCLELIEENLLPKRAFCSL